MRLDRYLANNTGLSRKEAKLLLRESRVAVDNNSISDPSYFVKDGEKVAIDGEVISILGPGYFMLNKPEGVVCANSDPMHPTVYDLLDEPHTGLHVAGRLDIDTTGLVLITGDGQWSHRVTSPRHECTKVYLVITSEFITEHMITKLEKGIFLEPEKIRTKPAKVELLQPDQILLHITEGKYHQVKRMLHAVDNAVDLLQRVQVGDIRLDEQLAPGEYRPLTQTEINSV
jgi:16S rRNA pseudouridine516 synthase